MASDVGRPAKFAVLDGLRGVAAICVVQIHTQTLLFGNVLPTSYLAVDLFFLLSGFVLAHSYENRLRQGMTLATFMAARWIRLYPLYLVGLAIGVAVILLDMLVATPDTSWLHFALWIVLGLLFLPTPGRITSADGAAFPFVPPAWSLFFELLVNLAFGAVARVLSNRVLAAIIAVSGALLAVSAVHFGTVNAGWNATNFLGGFPRVTFPFFLGVLLYRLRDKVPVLPWAGWPCLAVLLLLFSFPYSGPQSRVAFDLIAVGLLFPALVLVAAAARPSPRSANIFKFLGVTSYALYVLHAPILRGLERVAPRAGIDLHALAPWIGIAFIAAMLALSWTADRWFDAPFRARLNARFLPKPDRGITAPAL